MLVYKILIENTTQALGDTKVPMTLAQFSAVTSGGTDLWSELNSAFSCADTDLRATAVWNSATESWLRDCSDSTATELYETCARETGFW